MRTARRAKPRTVSDGVEPRNGHDRLLWMGEVGIVPIRRRHTSASIEKPRVFRNGDLGGRHGKAIHPNAVGRGFYILAGIGAHEEPAGGNFDLQWLDDPHIQC